MSDYSKKIVSVIGIVVGVAIIIIGFSLQGTSVYAIGEQIKFGADFYTEMYAVTQDVGHAINYAINDLIRAVGWLIVSLGAIDICFFGYKLAEGIKASGNSKSKNTENNVLSWVNAKEDEPKEKASENKNSTPDSYTHKWICDECGKKRTQTPCEHCGKE